MREVRIPAELEAQVESARGETPFDTWLALAIAEKAWGPRFNHLGACEVGVGELWMAFVQFENFESPLIWRQHTDMGVAMLPVLAASESDIEQWESLFAMELNAMDGPPIAWRHFSGGEFVHWLRAPAVEEKA